MRANNRLFNEPLIFLAYSALAVLFTYPLITDLSGSLAGSGSDAFAIYWVVWWAGYALQNGLNPFFSLFIYHPLGSRLSIEPLPFDAAHFALSQVLPALTAFNILYLLQFSFAGWGCYRLALYLWRSRPAALFAGLVYGFSPYMMMRGLGHLSLMANGFLPLALLLIFQVLEREKFSLSRLICAGVLTGLTCLTSTYITVYLALYFSGLAVYLALRGSGAAVKRLAVVAGVAGVMLLPVVVNLTGALSAGYYRAAGMLGQAYLASLDLFGLVAPPALHPFIGGFAKQHFGAVGSGSIERTAYIGLAVIGLSLIVFRFLRKHKWTHWLVWSTFGAWLLSLGPFLQIAGRMTFVPLPGFLLAIAPVMQHARNPGRWTLLITLGAALLAAGGLKYLLDKLPQPKGKSLITAVFVWTLFEYVSFPYPVADARIPAVLSRLPDTPGHPAALDLPLGRIDGLKGIGNFDARNMLYQTAHRRPIFSGYVSRAQPEHFAALKKGLLAGVVQAQAQAVSSAKPATRGDDIKALIRRWAAEGRFIIRPLRSIIGEAKYKDILIPPSTTLDSLINIDLMSAQAWRDVDSLGIGLVIVADSTNAAASAALAYLRGLLPLKSAAAEGKTLVWIIDYNRANSKSDD